MFETIVQITFVLMSANFALPHLRFNICKTNKPLAFEVAHFISEIVMIDHFFHMTFWSNMLSEHTEEICSLNSLVAKSNLS